MTTITVERHDGAAWQGRVRGRARATDHAERFAVVLALPAEPA